ncbi:hypothetical protein PS15m_011696 [Mucor circinelloides]
MNPAFFINEQPHHNIARNPNLQECERSDIRMMAITCGSLRGRRKAAILNYDSNCAAPWEMSSFPLKVQSLTSYPGFLEVKTMMARNSKETLDHAYTIPSRDRRLPWPLRKPKDRHLNQLAYISHHRYSVVFNYMLPYPE